MVIQENCIFCKILKGDIPASVVLDTQELVAFLDINPAQPGHVLIVAKTHAPTMLDLDPSVGVAVFGAIKVLGAAVMQATGATGFNVVQNNFSAAGQQVHHVHWHIIPRSEGDGLMAWPPGAYASVEAMQSMATSIKSACSQA